MHDPLAALDLPMTVRCVDGEVVILGPEGVALSLTADAAEESARRLAAAVAEARADPALPGPSEP